jgi:uncharacterized membrane protein YkoI
MKKTTVWAVALMAISGLAVSAMAVEKMETEKKEKKIEWNQVPAPVQKRLNEISSNAKFDEITMEQEEGGAEYEAAWKKGDRVLEAKVTANGDLLATETSLPESEVPATVVQAAKQKCPQATGITYEQKNMILYRVKATEKDGKECKLTLSADGHEKMFGKHEHDKGCECPKCKVMKDAKCDAAKDAKSQAPAAASKDTK